MRSSRLRGISKRKKSTSHEKLLEEVHKNAIDNVFQAMDRKVVSHKKLKEALVLGMISQEHVYVEGPPGAAKTLISETISKSTDLEFFFYQLHRDTRLDEIIGDASIVREKTPDGGEIIKQTTVPGGILTAEVCVLDDITRCPGEALNVLLRVLNERKFGVDSLPLRTAIATGNPNQENYYVEQLDPASLDRFTYQVETKGFVSTGEWAEAMEVLNMYSSPSSFENAKDKNTRPIRDLLSDAHQILMPQVEVPTRVKVFLLSFLKHLKEKFALNDTNCLLTDRTFLVKSVRAMKARAILNGRLSCKPEDLFVLELLTTFRTPPDVHENVPKLIEDVLSGNLPLLDERQLGLDRQDEDNEEEETDSGPKEHDEDGDGDDEEGDGSGDSSSSPETPSSNNSDESTSSSQEGSAASDQSESNGDVSEEEQRASGGNGAVGDQVPDRREDKSASLEQQEQVDTKKDGPEKEPTARPFKPFDEIKSPASRPGRHSDQDVVSNVDVILQALRGKLFGGTAEMKEQSGGSPRRWAASRGLTDMRNSDCVETALWFDRPSPRFPRRHWRGDHSGGGRVAVVRDTSRSMHGAWAAWASTLTSKIIEMGRKKKMQLGYLEFNHDITAPEGDQFFSNRYAELARLAKRLDCQGVTNYQLPIDFVLRRFDSEASNGRRISPRGESLLKAASRPGRIKHDIYGSTDYNHSHYTSWSTLDERTPSGPRNNHIIFLTDGVPTSGSRDLTHELAEANRLGVSIHTVFMGRNDFPQILHKMSLETGGARFSAWKHASTRAIEITRHRGSATIPTDMQNAMYARNKSMSYGGGGATGVMRGSTSSNIFGWYSRQCN